MKINVQIPKEWTEDEKKKEKFVDSLKIKP